MKNNENNEIYEYKQMINWISMIWSQLIAHTITLTVGKVSKYVICTTTICVIPISAKSYAFCVMLPMVSQVTSTPALSPGAVQSVLLTPYQANNKHGTIGRLPPGDTLNMHIFNLDYGTYQEWIIDKYYWRLKTIKNINLNKDN